MIELNKRPSPAYPALKSRLDACLALLALALLSPLLAGIAFGIRCTSPGPILFRQVRLGQGMEPFLLYKFRTMVCSAPRETASADLPCRARYVTRFGAFLRKTSLDELPQLFNVLRGEMALLGPRPVIPGEGELVARRACTGAYRVKPGLSGLAQVRGRDLLSDEEKADLDGAYAAHLSPGRDACLLFATVFAVLARRGLREEGSTDKGGKTIV